MTELLRAGRFRGIVAETVADIDKALSLRAKLFRAGACDRDHFDAKCTHVLIVDDQSVAVCTFRLLPLANGSEISRSYSAQSYDLSALSAFPAPMVEIGRFCIEPGPADADILRLAWGAITRVVDQRGIRMLFGCSSFPGTEVSRFDETFALLEARHLAPRRWRPGIKAPSVFRFASGLRRKPDLKRALSAMPPLLRSYLSLGGWVSDHAVVDPDLGTLHVFTGVEIASIPPARKRLLRAVVGGLNPANA